MNLSEIFQQARSIDENQPISKAISLLIQGDCGTGVVVTRNGQYFAMFDNQMLRNFTSDPSSTKVGSVARKIPTISLKTSPEKIIELMLETKCKCLPVVDENGYADKVVTRLGALQLVMNSDLLNGVKVADVMTSPVIKVDENSSIAQVAKTFREKNVYRAPVVDKSGKTTGIVTSYDLATKVKKANKTGRRDFNFFPVEKMKIEEENITSIMTSNPKVVNASESLKNAARMLIDNKVMGLIVLQGQTPIGVLAITDVLKACQGEKIMPVTISGLSDEQKMFKESLMQEANAFLEKLEKKIQLEENDHLDVRVKTHTASAGKQHRYEIKTRMTIAGNVYNSTNDHSEKNKESWELNMAFKDAMRELLKQIERNAKKPASIAKRNSDIKGQPEEE